MSDVRVLTGPEIAEHDSRESCWIIVHGKVYDVTDFLDGKPDRPKAPQTCIDVLLEHPGGSKIILKYAGKDATWVPPSQSTLNVTEAPYLVVKHMSQFILLMQLRLTSRRRSSTSNNFSSPMPPLG